MTQALTTAYKRNYNSKTNVKPKIDLAKISIVIPLL